MGELISRVKTYTDTDVIVLVQRWEKRLFEFLFCFCIPMAVFFIHNQDIARVRPFESSLVEGLGKSFGILSPNQFED